MKLYNFGSRSAAFKAGIQFMADNDFFYTEANGYKFYLSTSGYVMFSSRKGGFNGKFLHRVLLNDPVDMLVDHADTIKLNNCMNNLRVATHLQNQQNKTKTIINTSGYKNVCWHKINKKWRVDINKKNYGYFATVDEANQYAILKRAELHGEFARD